MNIKEKNSKFWNELSFKSKSEHPPISDLLLTAIRTAVDKSGFSVDGLAEQIDMDKYALRNIYYRNLKRVNGHLIVLCNHLEVDVQKYL